MKLRKKDKRSSAKKSLSKLKTVLDNSGQFGTVLDKMLCYNGRVKADGFGLSFVYELFTHSTGFLLDAEQSVLHGMLGTPRRKSLLPCPAQIAPESCRTMSHDVAQCRKTPKSICAIM